ncbi:MAG: tetratricopeptide repeat protein [Vicinamibacterales bacterium]
METERIEALKRRVASDPASVSFATLAEEYRRAGQRDAAIATCLAGLARRPDYVSARVTLGRALLDSGRQAEARVQFEMVVRLAPENLAAIRALALMHERETGDTTVQPMAAATPGDAPPAALSGLETFLAAIRKTRATTQNPHTRAAS